MSVMVKALGFYKHGGRGSGGGLAKAKSHLKYLEHGKQHDNRPVGFDHERDEMSRQEFVQRLEAQPERGVIAHKLVFSLSQDEYGRLGIDMKDLVRETMDAYARQLGRDLRWIGFVHMDRGHPHAHVVVAGYDGQGKQVGIYPKDLTLLREISDQERDRLAGWTRAREMPPPDRAEPRQEPVRDVGRDRPLIGASPALQAVQQVIQKMLQPQRSRDLERERGR